MDDLSALVWTFFSAFFIFGWTFFRGHFFLVDLFSVGHFSVDVFSVDVYPWTFLLITVYIPNTPISHTLLGESHQLSEIPLRTPFVTPKPFLHINDS